MYSICRNIHPATGVEHAAYCSLLNPRDANLVIAGANVIRVFRFIPSYTEPGSDKPGKMKLECVLTSQLNGNVMSMRSVSLPGVSRDALLISFMDCKLALVDYNSHTHDLRTLSLHYFEEEPDLITGWTSNYTIPMVRIDPENRCGVLLSYGRGIVILPIRKEAQQDGEGGHSSAQPQRTPVMASYLIKLKDIDERMVNVIDLQFLHGYYEPTLLILYEPLKTYAGRIAVRQDTCAMVAISLNISARVHPVIWSVRGLPFDCTRAYPVPKPIGGTLIFAVNSLIYLNQSVPPYAVSLNSIAETTTKFPLKVQEGMQTTLDSAQAVFITFDRLAISLRNGDLYILTLFTDSMRSVKEFHFEKAAASVLTTCMCLCEEGYLFLGSRLGNSLLLRYTEKSDDPLAIHSTEHQSKKKKTDNNSVMAPVTEEDLDMLEVYRKEDHTATQISHYTFQVCDSLLNIGPCGQVIMGEPAFLSEELVSAVDPDVELVTTSGYGKNGALSVLQRSIRPQVVTTFELPNCVDMWTVVTASEEADAHHSYLILSRESSTMILQTGQEINELESSGFNTRGPTIFAGNIGNNKYIIQVTGLGVRLLAGCEQLQHIPIDVGCPVVVASLADPYLVLMAEDGTLLLLTLQCTASTPTLVLTKPTGKQISGRAMAISCYCDMSGLITYSNPHEDISEQEQPQTIYHSKKVKLNREVDDEDELLYGDADDVFSENMQLDTEQTEQDYTTPKIKRRTVERECRESYWVLLALDDGTLCLYSLPDWTCVYKVNKFPTTPTVLADHTHDPTHRSDKSSLHSDSSMPLVHEILLVGLGHSASRPLLFARVDYDLVVYELYPYYEGLPHNAMKFRFRKLDHGVIIKENRQGPSGRKDRGVMDVVPKLRYFSNIAGYSGVFVCGGYPHWIMMTFRGELRCHPMSIDSWVTIFSPFHNVNCPHGFLYFNRKDELRICVLPTHLSYDSPWPVRKLPLRCTPHFIAYHLESKMYTLVTSTAEPSNRIYKFNGEDKELSIEDRGERFNYPLVDNFSIQLVSPVSWEMIPHSKMECDEWEHVTCMQTVNLSYEGARSGLKGYVAVGTNYCYGEDITSRGRIFILDIIEVVPEPGQPLTKNKFKIIYNKEQKGPVTALSHVKGYLVTAIGQKLYIWQLKSADLVGIAFIDMQVYVHQIQNVKSLLYCADIYKSVSLVNFQDEFKTLSLISRDFACKEIYAISYLIDGTQVAFLATDVERNLSVFLYQPEARESCGGLKLLRKCDINIGQHIHTFFRIRAKLTDPSSYIQLGPNADKKHITYYATLDGALGYIFNISEKTYRRLLMLQNVLNTFISHPCGLNPKAYRMLRSAAKPLGNAAKGILDGDLIWKYNALSLGEKEEIGKKIGCSTHDIIQDLLEVDRLAAHF